MNKKTNLGQYNTVKNIWLKQHIKDFIKKTNCKNSYDPFAGKGDLVNVAKSMGLCCYASDIDKLLGWNTNDSLKKIPYYKNTVVITNPCYLAKNSAKRMKLDSYKYFNNNTYVDLYQIAIDKILNVYDNAVAIIPETFLLSGLFLERLNSITVIEDNPFIDTDCPICVACFTKYNKTTYIYKNDEYLYTLEYLYNKLKDVNTNKRELYIKFNMTNGNLGLRAIDGTKEKDNIHFCLPTELNYDLNKINHSSRAISVIEVKDKNNTNIDIKQLINACNVELTNLRNDTCDLILSPFKNNKNNGTRRRRLDFSLARAIINKGVSTHV